MLPLTAFLPFLLMSCANSNSETPLDLPEPPPALKACVAELIPEIPGAAGTGLSAGQATVALGQQRGAALSKGHCSGDYDAFYRDLRTKLSQRAPVP